MLNEYKKRIFESEEEFFRALSAIKPCDLRDDETSMEDAIRFCKDVLTCFLKTGYMVPDKDKTELCLYRLGVCEIDKVAPKFAIKEDARVGDILVKGNIQFPLIAFDQVFICKDQESLHCSWIKLTEGGFENSWVAEWIDKQDEKKQENLAEPEIVDEPETVQNVPENDYDR